MSFPTKFKLKPTRGFPGKYAETVRQIRGQKRREFSRARPEVNQEY